MESQSSDEEDDLQHLINQPKSPRQHRPSPFQIDNNQSKSSPPPFLLRFNKRYLFAISLPLFFILLFFATDIKNLFQIAPPSDPKINQMRESELQAINLLKQQQLSLLKLFSLTNNSQLVNNQISLNNQIQEVLLSSHKIEDKFGFEDLSYSNKCKKADLLSDNRKIEWKPVLDKYLFAICTSGQMSNHLICLEKHMFFAAVLNRVLVIPSSKVDYEFKRVLDIEGVNRCVGRKVVVTFEEFAESRKRSLRIDRFVCYFSLPQSCFVDEEHVKKLKGLGVSIGKVEAVWVEDVKKPSKKSVKDVMEKFDVKDDVIAIGDVFFADVEKEWVMQPGGPIAHQCKTLIEPSRLILLTAQRFVQTFLGENFVALHFRRHGFLKFCNVKKPSCFYPVPQAAECITRIAERANAPVIYLSTDAAESETDLLQSLIMVNGKTVPLVKRPARNSAEKWDALLYRNHIEGDSQVEAMLDKTICALSSAFIGSSGSTFTEDILRLRKDWGTASLCDEYLCQGEVPNFIAEDEDAH